MGWINRGRVAVVHDFDAEPGADDRGVRAVRGGGAGGRGSADGARGVGVRVRGTGVLGTRASGLAGGWRPLEAQQRAEERAEEVAETLARIRAVAALRVPEWEPWMTEECGYAGVWRYKKWQPDSPE